MQEFIKVMKAASDVTISRATNYQPYIAALEKGCNITTPVPAEGYMDEDTAGVQYAAMGYSKLIEYSDENYIEEFKNFIEDKNQHQVISDNLKKNSFLREKNLIKLIKTRAGQ